MELLNFEREMRKLSSSSDLEIESVLDALLALISDLPKHHKIKLAEGTVRDPDRLNNNLSRLSNHLIKIYDTKKDTISQIPADNFPNGKIRALEQETTALREKLAGHDSAMAAAAAELKAVQARAAKADSELRAVNNSIELAESSLGKKTAARADLDSKLASLNQEIADAETLRGELSDQVYALDRELQTQNDRIASYRLETLDPAAQALDRAKDDYHALEQKLDDLKKQQEQAEQHRRAIDRKIGQVEFDIRHKTEKLEEESRKLQTLEAERNSKQQALDELNDKITNTAQNLTDILNEIEEAKKTLANWDPAGTERKYKQTLADLEQRKLDLKNTRETLNTDTNTLNSLNNEYNQLKREHDGILRQHQELTAKFTKLHDPKTLARISQYEANIALLLEARSHIVKSVGGQANQDCAQDIISDSIATTLDFCDGSLAELRRAIQKYTEVAAQSLECPPEL